MSDIVTSRVFQDGEKGITAQKLNDIVASSVIQPAFYTAKPTASTVNPTDIALILQSGAYAQAQVSTLGGAATQAQIWSTRLRSFNAVGNPNFEVDQRTAGVGVTSNAFALDRWYRGGVISYSAFQFTPVGNPPIWIVPGTNFAITSKHLRLNLTAQKVSLAATDLFYIQHYIEGSQLRELINDVHSFSILVRSNVASVAFGVSLRDGSATPAYSLTKLCTTSPTPNTWTLITLPNLPIWPTAGTFSITPGVVGYILTICLAAGSTYMSPANDTWQSGNFMGATGMSNFAANPVNSNFDIGFVQHEPGSVCSTLMDKPFSQNLDECLRYYTKSYGYGVAIAALSTLGDVFVNSGANQHAYGPVAFKKTMAKAPTVSVWSPITGTANNVRDTGSVTDRVVSALVDIGDSSFAGCTLTTPNTSATSYRFHYTADSGW